MSKVTEYKKFICQYCGEEFEKPMRYVRRNEKLGRPVRYCSRECLNHSKKTAVKVTCDQCGKEFKKNPKRIVNKNFCCKECWDKYRYIHKTKLICKYCGKEFYEDNSYLESQAKRGQKRLYCSYECKLKDMRKNDVKVKCDQCGKVYLKNKYKVGNKNFCSLSCRQQYHIENDRVEVKCKQCGKTFLKKKSSYLKTNSSFCCMKCFNEYRKVLYDNYEKIAHYLRTSTPYLKWRNEVIKIGHCMECGSENDLHAHHIKTLFDICKLYDFDTEKILDSVEFNDVKNGLCLCQKCHNKKHVYMKQKQYLNQ